MKERKLVIEIDDSAIDSVIEKVRLLKGELRSLSLPINISNAVPAALKPEEETMPRCREKLTIARC